MLDGRSSMWNNLIDGILVKNEDLFINTLYQAISKHPSYVILSDMDHKRKNTIISAMLAYYENKEDYEKCVILFEIQKELDIIC
tara:strand:+ start:106 stop:357 length:252 start_codon:yes stop_codon:yes gene_type:complete